MKIDNNDFMAKYMNQPIIRKEILGHNMGLFFRNADIGADCTYIEKSALKDGLQLEVWEMNREDFQRMCDIPEDEFAKMSVWDSWWRSADGCILGEPDSMIKINGHSVKAWMGKIAKRKKYPNLLTYFCDALGASQPRNICALAVDMAKYNKMSMAEIFKELQG